MPNTKKGQKAKAKATAAKGTTPTTSSTPTTAQTGTTPSTGCGTPVTGTKETKGSCGTSTCK